MLHSLRVWNFALLEEVAVEFGSGLNILTGETGAGKSILIDAIGAILGQRISSDMIRSGCDFLRVEAVFSVDEIDEMLPLLEEQEIEYDDELIIILKVSRIGKSSILVNGSHVTLSFLKKIALHLVDIHGQNENLALLHEDTQRQLLEGGDRDLSACLAEYQKVYGVWKEKSRLRTERAEEIEGISERLDMLRWQEREIAEAELREGEDEELAAEIRRLSHSEKLAEHAAEAHGTIWRALTRILQGLIKCRHVWMLLIGSKRNMAEASLPYLSVWQIFAGSLRPLTTMMQIWPNWRRILLHCTRDCGGLRQNSQSADRRPARHSLLRLSVNCRSSVCRRRVFIFLSHPRENTRAAVRTALQ